LCYAVYRAELYISFFKKKIVFVKFHQVQFFLSF